MKIKWMPLLLMSLILSPLSACGDDDDDDGGSSNAGRAGNPTGGGNGGRGGATATGGTGGATGGTGGTGARAGSGGKGGSTAIGGGTAIGGAAGDAGGGGAAGDAGAGGATATLNDQEIVDVVETANAGEVAQGQVARTRAQTTPVRDFATMMVEQHSAANAAAVTLAEDEDLAPEASAVSIALKDESDALVAQLRRVSAAAFDRTYMQSQVAVHTQVLLMLDRQLIPQADNAALRTFLESMRTDVQMHLAEAQSVLDAL